MINKISSNLPLLIAFQIKSVSRIFTFFWRQHPVISGLFIGSIAGMSGSIVTIIYVKWFNQQPSKKEQEFLNRAYSAGYGSIILGSSAEESMRCLVQYAIQASLSKVFKERTWLKLEKDSFSDLEVVSIAISSILFGLYHLFNDFPLNVKLKQVFVTTILGNIVGVVFCKKGLLAAMSTHAIYNCILCKTCSTLQNAKVGFFPNPK
ncbi:MAG: CPBP family intramembrane metalloprotease [Chlamydiae bacterium]|nr:CPBP family intramembrane metalloprotease [Chlamydiota bacterium]